MAAIAGKVGALYAHKRSCLQLDAANETVTIADPASGVLDFGLTSSFSVEMWVKLSTSFTDTANLLGKYATSTGYQLGIASDKPVFQIGDGTATPSITGGTSVDDASWHHIVGVRDVAGDKLYLYVDGASDAAAVTDTTTATLANSASLVLQGVAANTMKVATFRVWNIALSSSEVAALYGGAYVRGKRVNIAGGWNLFEAGGAFAEDETGNNNTGAIANATWSTDTYHSVTTEDHFGGGVAFSLSHTNVDCDNVTVTVDGTVLTTSQYTLTPVGGMTIAVTPSASCTVSYRYSPMMLEVGGYFQWSIDGKVDEYDITDFTAGQWREFMPGLAGWTGTCDRYWLNGGHVRDLNQRLTFRFYRDQPNAKGIVGWGYLMGANLTVAVDAVTKSPVTFRGVGPFAFV